MKSCDSFMSEHTEIEDIFAGNLPICQSSHEFHACVQFRNGALKHVRQVCFVPQRKVSHGFKGM